MKKGKWKVTMQYLGGVEKYSVVRIKDTSQPEHGGNREYAMGYTEDRNEAEALCEKLNMEEQANESK